MSESGQESSRPLTNLASVMLAVLKMALAEANADVNIDTSVKARQYIVFCLVFFWDLF